MALGLPVRAVGLHGRLDGLRVALLQAERGPQDQGVHSLERGDLVVELLGTGQVQAQAAAGLRDLDLGQHVADRAGVAAGVHPDRASHAPGHGVEELQPAQAQPPRLLAGGAHGRAGQELQALLPSGPGGLAAAAQLREVQDRAADSAIGHQDVGSPAQGKTGHSFASQQGEQRGQLAGIRRLEEQLRRAADAEGGVPAHGLFPANASFNIDFFEYFPYRGRGPQHGDNVAGNPGKFQEKRR